MPTTTVAELPPAVRDYYDRLLLKTAYPMLVHNRFAQKRVIPRKSGDTAVFRRYARLATVPIPLDDGITPPGAQLSATDIKARASFYGNFVIFTNQIALTVEDRVLNESSRLLAQNLAQTIDELTRDVLTSCTTIVQASGGTNGSTPTEITQEDIDTVILTLLGNDADLISEVITGEMKLGTTPVRPSFWGMLDTALLDDLEECDHFVSTTSYPNQKILDAEWGATKNVRWLYTSVGAVSTATPAVYTCPIVGKEAYGAVHLGSESGEFYVNPLGSAGAADPLKQRGSVGEMLAHLKSEVIDLEAYGESYGDKAQAGEVLCAA